MATKAGRPARMKGVQAREGQERVQERPVHGDCTFIVFGGTGDLARLKILPALSRLRHDGLTDDTVTILAVARDTGMDDRGFRDVVRQAVEDDGMDASEIEQWVEKTVFYQPIGNSTPDDFKALATRIVQLEKERGVSPNRVFYLALPPNVFPATIQGLGEAGLGSSQTGPGNGTRYWTRIVIEKPFGRDLQSAEALNELIHKYFDESQVYRIDHYLGKETVQNLLVFRFANSVFESLWNRDHVESVQVTVAEELGIEGRASYFEQAGAVRDILQNHGIQLISLVAMEVPAMMTAEFIRQEKVKALRSIKSITPQGLRTNVSVGIQYLAAWLRGTGAAAIDTLMEDAATAEICRSQVWQWRFHGRISDAEPRATIDEVAAELGPGHDEARALFEQVATGERCVEFLTLPAYEQLVAADLA